jgi:PKD repeat protein
VKRVVFLLIWVLASFKVYSQKPVVDFDATVVSGCSPLFVQFTDKSTNSPTSWQWDLGNGVTTTVQNASTTYSTPGSYTVRLIARNVSGTDSVVKVNYITVLPTPDAEFSVNQTSGCFPLPAKFTDLSDAFTGTITSWLWDFGDGNISTEKDPSHIYRLENNFNV